MLANVVLVVHFIYVSFVLGGFVSIWIGRFAGWTWIRNRTFRILHMAAMGLVAVEALAGITCPLTTLEDALRPDAYGTGFIEFWLHRILFYSAPAYVFTAIYVAFFALMVVTWFAIRPNPRRSDR